MTTMLLITMMITMYEAQAMMESTTIIVNLSTHSLTCSIVLTTEGLHRSAHPHQ